MDELLDKIELWIQVHSGFKRAVFFACDEIAAILVAIGLSVIAIQILKKKED